MSEEPQISDSEESSDHAAVTPTDFAQQLRDHIRRTWELELLISGAVVFALFQVPSTLDATLRRLEVHFSFGQAFTAFYVYSYAKMIVFVLIAAFLLHLVARAYWVGLLGLQSVFPSGILWDELKEGKIFVEESKRLPDVATQIERTDKLASSIFSFAFLLVYFFVLSVGIVGGLTVIALAAWSLWPDINIRTLFLVLIAIWMIPSTVPTLIDKAYRRKGKEPPPRVARFLRPMIRGYLRSVLAGLYLPVLQTFVTNVKGKRIYPLLVAAFAALFVAMFGGLFASKTDRELIHGLYFMPPREGSLSLSPRYYENLRQPGEVGHHLKGPNLSTLPTLSSDVVDTPFLKLFLPYKPSRDNETLKSICPDFKPWPWKLKPADKPATLEQQRASIDCLSKLYKLELDDGPLAPSFELYRHPQTGARGLLAYLRASELEPGRHLLRVEHMDTEREEDPRVHFLPFYR